MNTQRDLCKKKAKIFKFFNFLQIASWLLIFLLTCSEQICSTKINLFLAWHTIAFLMTHSIVKDVKLIHHKTVSLGLAFLVPGIQLLSLLSSALYCFVIISFVCSLNDVESGTDTLLVITIICCVFNNLFSLICFILSVILAYSIKQLNFSELNNDVKPFDYQHNNNATTNLQILSARDEFNITQNRNLNYFGSGRPH
ncbi:hypothetical protein ABK040_004631 [Willaertia magna]